MKYTEILRLLKSKLALGSLAFAMLSSFAAPASAQEEALAPAMAAIAAEEAAGVEDGPAGDYLGLLEAQGEYAYAFDFFTTSMLWTIIAAALVFVMHLGFATLEAGLTQQKNTVNILFKNCFIIAIGLISYAFVGFNTHYPGSWIIEGWLSWGGPIGDLNADGGGTFGYGGVGLAMTGYGDFLFQGMFAATAATIVSGAVAERIKLGTFMIFATILVGVFYPIIGAWHWGGGWLGGLNDGNGFKDFAGSAVVHAFGGFAALACVMLLGPRKGKYQENGKIRPIPGHSMPLATIGVFLLILGWFGFNGGSVLSADPGPLGLVITTTALAAMAGALGSILLSWIVLKKPDLSMALNGFLAGLVGITACADIVTAMGAMILGFIAGLIVVVSILFFDKVKIDDPVGAISVHGVCGVWGILSAAIFEYVPEGSEKQFGFFDQLLGVFVVGIAAFALSFIVFLILKVTIGVRVSEEEEVGGLDIGEHGQEAYPDFSPRTH